MIGRRRAVGLVGPLFLTLVGCPHAPGPPADPRAACAGLDRAACLRARALVIAAATYSDEQHALVLARTGIPSGMGLRTSKAGWRSTGTACARASGAAPAIDASTVTYAFAGVAVDGTLVAGDADLSPLLGALPATHEVRLVAVAFARDHASPGFDATDAVVAHAADGSCTCGDAEAFAGATRYGATLSFDFRAPRDTTHERAIDFVRRALGDARFGVRESNTGLTIGGLAELLNGDSRPLVFHLGATAPIAYSVAPLDDVCGFPTPETSPSLLDFGVAPYGTETTRTVHVVNRAPIDLQALVGPLTVPLPAHGAIDLPLHWTPDGDALRCETQTRDESLLFVPAHPSRTPPPSEGGGALERRARIFETVRTGRPKAAQAEPVVSMIRRTDDYAAADRDWSCPADFKRTSCHVENATPGMSVTAEPRGTNSCRFACRGPAPGKTPLLCRYEAAMECALECP